MPDNTPSSFTLLASSIRNLASSIAFVLAQDYCRAVLVRYRIQLPVDVVRN